MNNYSPSHTPSFVGVGWSGFSQPSSERDLSSLRSLIGTNTFGFQCTEVNHTVPISFQWDNMTDQFVSGCKQKRPWSSEQTYISDDPPCKVHINEEKVSMQFKGLSLHQQANSSQLIDASNVLPSAADLRQTTDAMWKRFYDLEQMLECDADVDEGVDLDADLDQSGTLMSCPKLEIFDEVKQKLNNPIPQIFVPRPSTELVLWKPSGVEILTEYFSETASNNPDIGTLNIVNCMKASRKKKSASRCLSPNKSLLVPPVRPITPPPDNRVSPISDDLVVCYTDENPEFDGESLETAGDLDDQY